MTKELYFQCAIMGLIGILIHLVFKASKEKQRAKVANVDFNILSYIKQDYLAITLSILVLIATVIGLDEIIGYKPTVLKIVKWFFLGVGYTGSSILISVMGKYSKKLNDVIDIKTDIADEKA